MKYGYFLFFAVYLFSSQIVLAQEAEITGEINNLHNRILTVDTHADTPMQLVRRNLDMGKRNNPYKRGGKVDFPRMKEGGLDAMFWAVFVGQGPRTENGHLNAKEKALSIISKIKEVLELNRDLADLALTADDAYSIESEGKRAVYIGMENGYPVGKDLILLEKYYKLGVRYVTLSHNGNNEICDSSTDDPEHNGISKFGEQVVKEMNRLGMIIDVSHISDESFFDVLKISKAPVVASHSCCRSLRDHPRNITDSMIKSLAENGGVIQITLVSNFIKKLKPTPERDSAMAELRKKYEGIENLSDEEEKARIDEYYMINDQYPLELTTVSNFVDHIDHVVEIAGINHVGIGSDFDGGGQLEDCFDVSEMKNITTELVRRGYSEEDISKIWGGNFMRVFRNVEKVSR
ncbi:dipeptidase [Bacteroidota bacterium]